jgi:hypothetical protein
MNELHINNELQLLGLKNKLLITLKYYLFNMYNIGGLCYFYRILDLLKQKYPSSDDFNFIEQGIRCNITHCNNILITLSNLSGTIYNCNNKNLLNDLLNSIDTGINYNLNYNHQEIKTLIIENTDISLEQNNSLQRIEESTNNL